MGAVLYYFLSWILDIIQKCERCVLFMYDCSNGGESVSSLLSLTSVRVTRAHCETRVRHFSSLSFPHSHGCAMSKPGASSEHLFIQVDKRKEKAKAEQSRSGICWFSLLMIPPTGDYLTWLFCYFYYWHTKGRLDQNVSFSNDRCLKLNRLFGSKRIREVRMRSIEIRE